jgi:hypothetical protein
MSNVALENLHRSLLDSLRKREENILQFIAILGPALGGYFWLIARMYDKNDMESFFIGTVSIIFFLSVGLHYSVALGFGFRAFQLQIKKLESNFEIQDQILIAWQKSQICYEPPEIIKVFTISFLMAICAITVISICVCCENVAFQLGLLIVGTGNILLVILVCLCYKKKFQQIVRKEEKTKLVNGRVLLWQLFVAGIGNLFLALFKKNLDNAADKDIEQNKAK